MSTCGAQGGVIARDELGSTAIDYKYASQIYTICDAHRLSLPPCRDADHVDQSWQSGGVCAYN